MMEINGESTSMMWPILGSRTAKEQNRTGLASVVTSAHMSFAHAGQNDSGGQTGENEAPDDVAVINS